MPSLSPPILCLALTFAWCSLATAYELGSPEYRVVVAMSGYQDVEDCTRAGDTMTESDVEAVALYVRRVVAETGLDPSERDVIWSQVSLARDASPLAAGECRQLRILLPRQLSSISTGEKFVWPSSPLKSPF